MTATYNGIQLPLFIYQRVKQVPKPFEIQAKFTLDVDRQLDRVIYQATRKHGV